MRRFLLTVLWITSLPLGAQTPLAACKPDFRAGVQLQDTGRYAAAIKTYSVALDEARRRLGPEHVGLVPILTCLGGLHALQGDYSRANAAFEQSLTILEKGLGPDHVQVGLRLGTIAMLTHKQGHYASAEPLYRRAITILETKPGPAQVSAALLQASMAKLCLAQRRNTEAEALLERAIPVLEKDDTNPADLAVALNDLAGAYRQDGRYAKAEPLYARVLLMVQQNPGTMNHDIRTGLEAYVHMLRAVKRKSEARQLELQVKTLLPK